MTIEMVHPALIEDELLTLDRDYLTVYGSHLDHWSRGVRGEYLALSDAATKRTMYREHLPQHPRRSSAGSRRHHRKYLPWRISLLVPGAATILLTPVWTDAHGDMEIAFMALVRDNNGRQMKLQSGGSQRLAALMQGAFTADWAKPQTWRADLNTLREYPPPAPDYIESVSSQLTESYAAWDARINAAAAKAGA